MAEAHLGQMIAPAAARIRAGVDHQICETVEAAHLLEAEGLRLLSFFEADIEKARQDVCHRDEERLSKQVQVNAMWGRDRPFRIRRGYTGRGDALRVDAERDRLEAARGSPSVKANSSTTPKDERA